MTASSRRRSRTMRCQACQRGDCAECTDVMRVALGQDPRCPCDRIGHGGEPHGAPGHVCNAICAAMHAPPAVLPEGHPDA